MQVMRELEINKRSFAKYRTLKYQSRVRTRFAKMNTSRDECDTNSIDMRRRGCSDLCNIPMENYLTSTAVGVKVKNRLNLIDKNY